VAPKKKPEPQPPDQKIKAYPPPKEDPKYNKTKEGWPKAYNGETGGVTPDQKSARNGKEKWSFTRGEKSMQKERKTGGDKRMGPGSWEAATMKGDTSSGG